MGLLSKAAAMTTLDETGKALVDRLTKLPRTHTLSDTALNMLRSYIPFKRGACLSRGTDAYVSFSILGFGLEKIHIPQALAAEHKEKWHKIPETNINELKDEGNEDSYYWIFHVTDVNPPEAMLLLSADAGFFPETVSRILEKAEAAFMPFEKNSSEDSGKDEPADIINEYFDASGTFNCCIFSTSIDEETPDEILRSIKSFGRLLPLKGNTFILLFPLSIDHELLLHHLNKRFHLNIVEQFSADTPQKVLDCIQHYV